MEDMGFYVLCGVRLLVACWKQYYIFVGLELVGSPQFIDLLARPWLCLPPYEPTKPYTTISCYSLFALYHTETKSGLPPV